MKTEEQRDLLKKGAENVEHQKNVPESELGDFFLTMEEEKEVEETLKQREKGEILTMKEVFGD